MAPGAAVPGRPRVAQGGGARRPRLHRRDAAGQAAEAESARAGGGAARRAAPAPAFAALGRAPSRSPAPASSTSGSSPQPSSRWCARCWPPAPPSAGSRAQRPARAGRVRLGQPDRPAARGPRPPGRAGRRASATCYATQGWDVYARVLLQRRRRADRHAGHVARSCAPRASSRATPAGPRRPTTATTSPTSPPTSWRSKTVKADDREFTASGDVDDLDAIRQFAVAYLRHEQDLDLQAFEVQLRQLLPRVQPVHQRPGRGHGAAAGRRRQDLRAGRRAVAAQSTDYGDDKDRVMRKSDGSYTYFVPDVAYHIAKWERGFTQGGQHPGHRPPRHHRARARRPAGGRRRHSRRATPTTCCTPWCA